jgi:NSS family neurotransmitter:Na+ symporter
MAIKEHWRSGFGFVLAAAGSAVGLGNLWGFAYRASQGGGGAFLFLYLLIVLVVCLPVLVAEMVLGRSTGHSPLLAPVTAAGKRWQPMGWLFVLASCGILAFYAVLMGWTGVTLIQVVTQGLPADIGEAEAFFAGLSGGRAALLGQLVSLVLTAVVVAAGVRGGIERLSRWGLPLLFALLIGLAIWAAGLDGAGEGYRTFLLRWDGSELTNLTTIRNAFTQAFFSIGTGIGCILAYSAYLDRDAHLPREAVAVVGMDTAVGLLAGMVTFPCGDEFWTSGCDQRIDAGHDLYCLAHRFGFPGINGKTRGVVVFRIGFSGCDYLRRLAAGGACGVFDGSLELDPFPCGVGLHRCDLCARVARSNIPGRFGMDGLGVWRFAADPWGVATGSFARLGGAPTLLRRFGTVVHPSGAAPFPPGVVALGVPTDRCYGPGDQRDRPGAGLS